MQILLRPDSLSASPQQRLPQRLHRSAGGTTPARDGSLTRSGCQHMCMMTACHWHWQGLASACELLSRPSRPSRGWWAPGSGRGHVCGRRSCGCSHTDNATAIQTTRHTVGNYTQSRNPRAGWLIEPFEPRVRRCWLTQQVVSPLTGSHDFLLPGGVPNLQGSVPPPVFPHPLQPLPKSFGPRLSAPSSDEQNLGRRFT